MAQQQKYSKNKTSSLNVLVKALSDKKEIKSRVKNGEDLRTVTKEKGLRIVLPL